MKSFAVLSLKGGVGKTTLVTNLGAALEKLGKRVLVIDLDPQQDLTYSHGINLIQSKGIEFLLEKDLKFEDVVIKKRENLHLLPAGKKLKELELSLSNMFVKAKDTYFCYLLRNILSPVVEKYDYAVIDCPPTAGFLTINALVYVSNVLVPVQCHHLGLESIKRTISLISRVRKFNHLDRRSITVVPTMFDVRNRLCAQIADKLYDRFQDGVTQSKIRVNVALAEAPGYGKSVFEYRPDSRGARDFLSLAGELIQKFDDSKTTAKTAKAAVETS